MLSLKKNLPYRFIQALLLNNAGNIFYILILNMITTPYLAKVQDYTFLYNERNSNSNRRFRFGSNINGIRFYANITDLPKPNIPARKSFSLVFQDCDIFDKKLFESSLLNYLNPDTWYIVIATLIIVISMIEKIYILITLFILLTTFLWKIMLK